MDSLRDLHHSMGMLHVDMQQFCVRTGATEFECLFSVREKPYTLALTSRGINPQFILLKISINYWISDYLGENYFRLLEALKTGGHTGQKLIPKNFFAQLNEVVPRRASVSRSPKPEAVARLRPDLEEADRPYFDTWIIWSAESGRMPSAENRQKTLALLGIDAFRFSESVNASSKWSVSDTGRTWQGERRRVHRK